MLKFKKLKIQNVIVCLALVAIIGCNEQPQKIRRNTVETSVPEEEPKNTKQKNVQTVAKYEGLYLGMSKDDALQYIRYDEISYSQISALEYVFGEDKVSRSNAYEIGLPHQFFFDMYHLDFREKNFEFISLSFTDDENKLWKIKISYELPEKKEDQYALEVALKEKFMVKTVQIGRIGSLNLMSTVLFDEELASRNLKSKKEDYLSDL
ncbi:hypothetical protein [Alteromonas antoniana]|uniref:hypothetical protein n=1 Tax=Alteromonas antoniana TaxID=2803813 RepID=UPI001C444774|nr:hypothetical protein [Alteromonas antoniana]